MPRITEKWVVIFFLLGSEHSLPPSPFPIPFQLNGCVLKSTFMVTLVSHCCLLYCFTTMQSTTDISDCPGLGILQQWGEGIFFFFIVGFRLSWLSVLHLFLITGRLFLRVSSSDLSCRHTFIFHTNVHPQFLRSLFRGGRATFGDVWRSFFLSFCCIVFLNLVFFFFFLWERQLQSGQSCS